MAHAQRVIETLRNLKRSAARALVRRARVKGGAVGLRGVVEATSTGHVVHIRPEAESVAWQPLDLLPGRALMIRADVSEERDVKVAVDLHSTDRRSGTSVVATVRFLDGNDRLLPPPYMGCRVSDRCAAYLSFPISDGTTKVATEKTLSPPEGARRVEIRLRHADRSERVLLRTPPVLQELGPANRSAARTVPPKGWQAPSPMTVATGQTVVWAAHLQDASEASPKAAVLEIRAYNKAGQVCQVRFPELASSPRFPNYSYVGSNAPGTETWHIRAFSVPEGVCVLHALLHRQDGGEELTALRAGLQVLRLEDVPDMLTTWPPHEAWLEPAIKLAQAEGALLLQERLLRALVELTSASPESAKRLRAVRAELEELAPDWYPRIDLRATPAATGGLTICHLHKTAYPFENTGGAIRCLNTLKSQLAEGMDPYVITPPGYPAYDGISGGDVAIRESVEGCDFFRIGPNTAGVRTLSSPARVRMATVQSSVVVARRGAHVIHAASGVRGYELALQSFALRDIFDVPVIYEVRSFHEHTWAPAGPRVFDLERTQLRIAKENRCMEMADHVVTISESMRQILIGRGVPESKIDVIPNGIDADEFREAPPPARIPTLEGAQLVVGYVSNMSRREGHRHLIEAVARLRSGGLDCRCLFVGAGPERKTLEELAARLGLGTVIHFAGEVDHREIKAYYMAIDVFVIPRVPDYAADWVTPLKPYEAMALGRPLVVTDLPALREVVGEGDRGLIAAPADAESLTVQILRYAEDEELRRRTAQKAQRWVFEHRTWKANALRYRDIYERVIEQHRATRGLQGGRDAGAD